MGDEHLPNYHITRLDPFGNTAMQATCSCGNWAGEMLTTHAEARANFLEHYVVVRPVIRAPALRQHPERRLDLQVERLFELPLDVEIQNA